MQLFKSRAIIGGASAAERDLGGTSDERQPPSLQPRGFLRNVSFREKNNIGRNEYRPENGPESNFTGHAGNEFVFICISFVLLLLQYKNEIYGLS